MVTPVYADWNTILAAMIAPSPPPPAPAAPAFGSAPSSFIRTSTPAPATTTTYSSWDTTLRNMAASAASAQTTTYYSSASAALQAAAANGAFANPNPPQPAATAVQTPVYMVKNNVTYRYEDSVKLFGADCTKKAIEAGEYKVVNEPVNKLVVYDVKTQDAAPAYDTTKAKELGYDFKLIQQDGVFSYSDQIKAQRDRGTGQLTELTFDIAAKGKTTGTYYATTEAGFRCVNPDGTSFYVPCGDAMTSAIRNNCPTPGGVQTTSLQVSFAYLQEQANAKGLGTQFAIWAQSGGSIDYSPTLTIYQGNKAIGTITEDNYKDTGVHWTQKAQEGINSYFQKGTSVPPAPKVKGAITESYSETIIPVQPGDTNPSGGQGSGGGSGNGGTSGGTSSGGGSNGGTSGGTSGGGGNQPPSVTAVKPHIPAHAGTRLVPSEYKNDPEWNVRQKWDEGKDQWKVIAYNNSTGKTVNLGYEPSAVNEWMWDASQDAWIQRKSNTDGHWNATEGRWEK